LHDGRSVAAVYDVVVLGRKLLERTPEFAVKCREVYVVLIERYQGQVEDLAVYGALGGDGD
jgi:hypothetical protein